MTTKERLLAGFCVLLLGSYSVYTTVRIEQLEDRLNRQLITIPPTDAITYAFDSSFVDYFGPQGMDEVERALRRLSVERPDMPRMQRDQDRLRLDLR
jgi:hypothetical protein